ncbi:MAG: response regulator transcription factor [Bacilli bacterium]|nr:response regulator transcription factor [Bacilli bacterium]
MKILLVEDNLSIIKGLDYTFKSNNYDMDYKTNIKDTIECLDNKYDLIVLDITLPDGNGIDLYKNYIKDLNIPVIFLTAIDDEETIVNCLDNGAEDYITKPFSSKELIARINKILNRNKKNVIKINNIKFDIDKMCVYKDEEIVELTSLELKILSVLFNNINKVVSRESLLSYIWEWTGNDVDDHTITVYLNRIKNKLDVDIIKTVKGIGYRIDEEESN